MTAASDALPQRKSLPHQTPSWVKSGSLYFLTLCCTPRGANQLCRPHIAAVSGESVAHRQKEGIWHMRLLVLMPDHLHALVSVLPTRGLTTTIRLWKSFLARQAGLRWQRDFSSIASGMTNLGKKRPVTFGITRCARTWWRMPRHGRIAGRLDWKARTGGPPIPTFRHGRPRPTFSTTKNPR